MFDDVWSMMFNDSLVPSCFVSNVSKSSSNTGPSFMSFPAPILLVISSSQPVWIWVDYHLFPSQSDLLKLGRCPNFQTHWIPTHLNHVLLISVDFHWFPWLPPIIRNSWQAFSGLDMPHRPLWLGDTPTAGMVWSWTMLVKIWWFRASQILGKLHLSNWFQLQILQCNTWCWSVNRPQHIFMSQLLRQCGDVRTTGYHNGDSCRFQLWILL